MRSGCNLSSRITRPLAKRVPKMNRRFLYAMLTYAILAILAGFTLDGLIRIATLVLLGGFALKTYLAVLKDRVG
jgi:hypothetical protein